MEEYFFKYMHNIPYTPNVGKNEVYFDLPLLIKKFVICYELVTQCVGANMDIIQVVFMGQCDEFVTYQKIRKYL